MGLTSFASNAEGADDCSGLLSEVTHQIHFSDQIPEDRRAIFIRATNKVRRISKHLAPLPDISFELTDIPGVVGAFAYFQEDKVKMTQATLRLSDGALEDLMIHEVTHFLVAKNFNVREENYKTMTIHEFSKVPLSPSAHSNQLMEWYAVNANHAPYAELLCDVASVLINRNPTTFVEIFYEFFWDSANDEETFQFLSSLMVDQPFELNSRDFSIHHEDHRWNHYDPKKLIYNRFNQIRSYLWHRYISDLPAEKEAEFFAKLVDVTHKIYASQRLDQLTAIVGLKDANAALIELLEQDLLLDGKDPLNNAN